MLCLILLISTFLWGSVIKESEVEFKDKLIYKIGENTPFIGKIKYTYDAGNIKAEIEVKSGVIGSIKIYQEDGKISFDGKHQGNQLTGKIWEYFSDGQPKTDMDFTLELTKDSDMQEMIAKIEQKSPLYGELASEMMENGKMQFAYREYLSGPGRKVKTNVEMQLVDGLLTGKGTGIQDETSGSNIQFQFRIGNLQKLNYTKIINLRENPQNINFNEISTEILSVIRIEEFLVVSLGGNNSPISSMNIKLESGKLTGTLAAEAGGMTPQGKIELQLDKLTDVDWNAISALQTNLNPMAGVTTILAEISKVKSITLVADVLQNNKKIQTKISITSGKLDVVSSILYNSGKPRCTLIAHINNIKNIDINKINPQSGSSGMMQAIGITGQYTEYGENGKVSYQSPWTPDTSDVVLAKMALMMQ